MTSAFVMLIVGVTIVFGILIITLIALTLRVHRANKKAIEQAKKQRERELRLQ